MFYLLVSMLLFFFYKNNKLLKNSFILLFLFSFIYFLLTFSRISVRGRYLLPSVYSILGVLGLFLEQVYKKNKMFFYISIFVVMTINLLSFLPIFNFPTSKFLDLVCFLQKEKIQYAYSDYWTAYPITFLSKENIIVAPRVADHSGFHDRTPHYNKIVSRISKKCIILPSTLEKEKRKIISKLKICKINFCEISFKDKYQIILFNYKDDITQLLK